MCTVTFAKRGRTAMRSFSGCESQLATSIHGCAILYFKPRYESLRRKHLLLITIPDAWWDSHITHGNTTRNIEENYYFFFLFFALLPSIVYSSPCSSGHCNVHGAHFRLFSVLFKCKTQPLLQQETVCSWISSL